jgi:mRNA interferase RelE/StbE
MDTTEYRGDELAMTAFRDHLAETVANIQHDGRRVYLTKAGRRVAAVVPVDEAELLDRLEDEYFGRRAEEALAAQGDKPFKTYAELLAEVDAADRAKQFKKLDKPVRRRVDMALTRLAANPRPVGAIKLKGSSGAMRFRVGDWRIIYQIRDGELVIVVIEIGHRSHVYDDL